jgi:heme/copper-type cytochrome/quinol oxidase subunit 3
VHYERGQEWDEGMAQPPVSLKRLCHNHRLFSCAGGIGSHFEMYITRGDKSGEKEWLVFLLLIGLLFSIGTNHEFLQYTKNIATKIFEYSLSSSKQ